MMTLYFALLLIYTCASKIRNTSIFVIKRYLANNWEFGYWIYNSAKKCNLIDDMNHIFIVPKHIAIENKSNINTQRFYGTHENITINIVLVALKQPQQDLLCIYVIDVKQVIIIVSCVYGKYGNARAMLVVLWWLCIDGKQSRI